MRLAVISDVHGNIAALEAVLDDIVRRGIEQIVNLGDCLSGPFDAAATATRLIGLGLPTVRGNHDRALIDRPQEAMGLWEQWAFNELSAGHLEWISSLPPVLKLGDVFLCHATPQSDEENWLDYRGPGNRLIAHDLPEVVLRASGADCPVILCGHTHAARVVRLPDGRMIMNPGAVGCPAYLDARVNPPFVHQTGSPDARYGVLEHVGGRWKADLCAVPYDTSEMERLARNRGAGNWVQALRTGWIA